MLRWHIHYNLLLLRMLSFSSDLHWARTHQPELTLEHGWSSIERSKARISQHLPQQLYNFLYFVSYCFYPPLYIAGPIISFNNFTAQRFIKDHQTEELQPRRIFLYALRWCAAMLSLEVLTHTLYFNCIAKLRAWPALEQLGVVLTPLHYAEGSYWVLVFMWLKVTKQEKSWCLNYS